jgi:tetratricopeptide (TPR) repeat protein
MAAAPKPNRSRVREWSRMAWGLGLLFASLPLAARLFLGSWGFDGAAEIAAVLLILGGYLHFISRRGPTGMPDPAAMLDQASDYAAAGRIDRAIAQLNKTIRRSPRFWQAFQYRGELLLRTGRTFEAIQDLSEAIRLAPAEGHLYRLRGKAFQLLGDEAAARGDFDHASALANS